MADLLIRPAAAADRAAIVELLSGHLGFTDGARAEELWRWKHERNPFGPSPCLIALSGDQIVSVRGFMRWRWQCGTESLEAVRAVDTATHRGFRRQGLFSRLTTQLLEALELEGISFVFNTPNSQSRPGYLKLGWTQVTKVPLLVRLKKPLRAVSALVGWPRPTMPTHALEAFASIGRLLEEPRLPELLAVPASAESRLRTPLTAPYLRWRYHEAPGLDYRASWTFEGTAGAALIFRWRQRHGLRELSLSEVLLSDGPDGVRLARALLRQLIVAAEADYLVACAAAGTGSRAALRGAGFLPAPLVGPSFVVRLLAWTSGTVDPRRWSDWCCSIGDLEVF